jgi:hypothetical protein
LVKDAGFIRVRSYSSLLTKDQRNSFPVPPDLHEILIGLSLGNLFIRRLGINALLMFKQGLVNKDYIYQLFNLFSSFSNMKNPRHCEHHDKRTNKIYTSIDFHTYSLLWFNYYYDLFDVNGVKITPLNIGELLTSRALAY